MHDREPPTPGAWTHAELGNTGAWSIGKVWLDRSAGCYGLWVRPEHCNAFGVMHGGAMATFVDAQLAAVRDYVGGAAMHTPTVSLSIDYLAPTPLGSWLLLTAQELHATRTMIFSQAVVTADGDMVARSNAIYRAARG